MTTYISARLRRLARRRSGRRCEYCRRSEAGMIGRLQLDHVIAEQHGGRTAAANLALACADCNRLKGPNVATLDPRDGDLVPLFHPRRDRWEDHFALDGPRIRGLTARGRGTLRLLKMNDAVRLVAREADADD